MVNAIVVGMSPCICVLGVLKGLVSQALEKLHGKGRDQTDALVHALEKREGKVEVASIDMEQELRDLRPFELFPSSVWPSANQVIQFARHCLEM